MSDADPALGRRGPRITKQAELEPEDGRFARFVASSNAVDRYGDIVEQNWQLDNFWKNPVFLWAHNSGETPIGWVRSFDVHATDAHAATHARVEFLPEGADPFVDKLARLVALRAIRAVSVGFYPLETADMFDDDEYWTGWRYLRNELLELSLCTVPANPEAVALARSLDPGAKFLRRVCEDPFTAPRARPPGRALVKAENFPRRNLALLDLHRRKYPAARVGATNHDDT